MDDAKRAAIEKFFSTDLRFMPRYNLYDFGNAEEKQKLKRDNEDLMRHTGMVGKSGFLYD